VIHPEKIERVLDALDPQEVIDLTAKLVRLNSVWDPEAGTSEQQAAEAVASWAENAGFAVTMEDVSPGRPNVIVRHQSGNGPRRLMFEGHTDVVTPGDIDAWRHAPFGAQVVDGRMYGRGTNDTKGNLAAMLIAMAAIKNSGVKLAGEIIGGVLCDEEDQMLGVRDFIRRGHADAVTAAIICEPEDGRICCTQKGAIRAMYTVVGRMSHGAMPLSGLNPVPGLARLIDGLGEMERSAITTHGVDDLLGWPSFTPTVVRAPASGPGQLNVVPSACELLLDIRTIPGQFHGEIIAELQALAERTQQDLVNSYTELDTRIGHVRDHNCEVAVEILTDRPTTLTDREDPVVRAVDWATRTVTGKTPIYDGVPGATDGTYLWARKGIPIVTIGAGEREVPHQIDEWVDLDQLVAMARIYALSALAYLDYAG
jgi:succinyl-diaminopimelate desuccinylase